MKNTIIYILVLILLVIGGVFAFEYYKSKMYNDTLQNQVVCTMDAKVCPDGSYVGRAGPQCEFVDCPVFIATTTTATATTTTTVTSINVAGTVAKLGETVTVDGVSITPISIIEESRCPTDVQCIQAGAITIKAKLVRGNNIQEMSLKLDTPTSFDTKVVTLNDAIPKPNTKVTLKDSDYRFSFNVKDSIPLKGTGILKGNVSISPICPVEKIDNPCSPTPAMYAAAKIYIYTIDKKTLVTTITPDNMGNFLTTLAKGGYFIDMTRQPVGSISGVPRTVYILDGKTNMISIKVDTGIR